MKYGYMSSNPVKGTELPPEPIREREEFPIFAELSLLIERLQEPVSTAVWLVFEFRSTERTGIQMERSGC